MKLTFDELLIRWIRSTYAVNVKIGIKQISTSFGMAIDVTISVPLYGLRPLLDE